MHSSTLRGVFPDPKPVYRRNFIKENVKSIKQMQGVLQEAGVIQARSKKPNYDLYKQRQVPKLTKSKASNESRSSSSDFHRMEDRFTNTNMNNNRSKFTKKQVKKTQEDDNRLTDRAMQTEREENLSRLYDTGVIKYPSPGIVKETKRVEKITLKSPQSGQGDNVKVDDVAESFENVAILEDKDFIKENKTIKNKPHQKQSPVKVSAQVPLNYQRGVVPKYLRDRKDDTALLEIDMECPPGHVLLPEEERKETLRVLRQSYADRIQELNMMPVRNDTLKMKRRKMDIEEELKRIDGGIKVFQRPKVYVKINA